MSKIREMYKSKVVPNLIKKFGYKNILQVPKLEKIVLNIGVGESLENKSFLERAVSDLSMISGQKPLVTKAKKSISNFKLRAGMPIGCKVTLHGKRMFEFFDRLIHIAIPRIRDFRGLTDKSFDGKGNYTLGVKEQIIFPEIDYDKIDKLRGMNITIVTSAKTDEEGLSFLKELGMPFVRK